MSKPHQLLILLSLVLLSLPASALKVIITDGFTNYNLGTGVKYRLQDDDRRPGPEDTWEVAKDTPTLGFNPQHLWLHFSVKSRATNTRTLILDVKYPLLDELDVIIEDTAGETITYELGDTRPIERQPIDHPHLLAPITINPGEELQVLIRARSEGTLNVPMTLWAENSFISNSTMNTTFSIAMYGILIGIALYHLLLFAQLRDSGYLWYALFLVTLVSIFSYFQGYFNAYVVPDYRNHSNHFLAWGYALTEITCGFYMLRALGLRETRPGYAFAIYVSMAAGAALVVHSLYAPYSESVKLLTLYVALASIVVVSAQIRRALDRFEPAYYGLAGGAFLVIGLMITIMEKTGVVTSTPITRSAGDLGFTIMAILYALLLSQRMKWEQAKRHEAEHSALISQAELLRTQKQLNQELDTLVSERTLALEEANERLQLTSITDPLTGLYNRRHFDHEYYYLYDRARHGGSWIALLLLDIDHFKRINDRYGHPTGDTCLIEIAERIRAVSENFDGICARYGGEEFIIIMSDRSLEQADRAAKTLLTIIRELPVETSEHSLQVTASIGVAAVQPTEDDDPETLLKHVDDLLYKAKHNGRNQISVEQVNACI